MAGTPEQQLERLIKQNAELRRIRAAQQKQIKALENQVREANAWGIKNLNRLTDFQDRYHKQMTLLFLDCPQFLIKACNWFRTRAAKRRKSL